MVNCMYKINGVLKIERAFVKGSMHCRPNRTSTVIATGNVTVS